MKLKNKFLLRSSPLLLIIIIFSILGIRTFFSYNQSMVKLKQDIEPEALAMLELKESLTALEVFVSTRSIDKEKLKSLIQRLNILADKHLDHEHTSDAADKTAHDIKHLALRSINYAHYLSRLEKDDWADEDRIRGFYKAIHREHGDLGQILDKHLALHLQDLATTKSTMSNQYRAGIIVIWCGAGIGLLTTLYGIYSLMQMVLFPIKSLQQSIQQVGERSFKDSFSLQTGDEFEELALEFEKMAEKLEKSYHQLDAKVLARTRELSETNVQLTKEIGERKQAEQEQLKAEARVHLLTQKILTVQETERKRISLDLHDNVAQELSALKVYSENFSLQHAGGESQLRDNMRKWAKTLNCCIGTVRDLSYNLRPPSIEQIGITGTLAEYCEDFSKQNELTVDFVSAGMERLSTRMDYEVAINIYRFVQEALNNIQQHAHANQVTVRLVASGPSILLRIEDNGCGCDLAEARERALSEKRLGLLGMQERIQLLHGTIKIQSSPGKGMKISAEIPCKNIDIPG